MIPDYLLLGETEIINTARLRTYLDTVGSPLDSVTPCGCGTLEAEHVGDDPYTTPDADTAPWYDPDIPESADFVGFLPMEVTGFDDHPVTREVTTSITGGAAFARARTQPRTITVTGILLGVTCCAVAYGLRWLSQALGGCTGSACGGDCLTGYICCPDDDEAAETDGFERHRRTLRRVGLTSGPTVTARSGTGCSGVGGCSVGADILTVEFVLTAGVPWAWTSLVPVLNVDVPSDDGECITWCIHGGDVPPAPVCVDLPVGGVDPECGPDGVLVPIGEDESPGEESPGDGCVQWPVLEEITDPCVRCRLAPCPDPEAGCQDPTCRTPTPPAPPPPSTCFCTQLAVNEEFYDLDLSDQPRWFASVPVIEVHAGSASLRRVTVTFYERTGEHEGLSCEEVAYAERCSPAAVFEASFVPEGGVLTFDGQTGRAIVECRDDCETSQDSYGADGGPIEWPDLDCDQYCISIAADAIVPPADDARVVVAVTGREY